MREIKFRGKRVFEPCEWVYGNLLVDFESPHHEHRITAITFFDGWQRTAEINPKTVGQYIGFKDKNGVEIYEGDIVKVWSISVGDYVSTVIFTNGCFGIRALDADKYGTQTINILLQLTVIGNIYENPELMEAENGTL